jgi:hypothetical protein
MTRNIASSITTQLRKQLSEKIEVTFDETKKGVMQACNETIDTAVKQVTAQCSDSIILSVGEQIATQCNVAILSAVQEVTSTAIAHYQERVEILMEKEMVSASVRRARTEAALLSVYKELKSSGAAVPPQSTPQPPTTPIPNAPVPSPRKFDPGPSGNSPDVATALPDLEPAYKPTPVVIPLQGTPQPPATPIISYLNVPVPSPWKFSPDATTTLPDLIPGYNPTADVEKIVKATKGWGTDEAALISTLAHLSSLQLASLGAAFKVKTGKELVGVLDDETSWWFKATLHGLALGPLWYDVELASQAVKGAG